MTDKPEKTDIAPKITFEDSDSYYSWFREAAGWVVNIIYHDDSTDERVFVESVDDVGLMIREYTDDGPHGDPRSVSYNQINTLITL